MPDLSALEDLPDTPAEDKQLKKNIEKTQEYEPIHTGPKVGRNEPCPCVSGKKYKNCCLWK